MVGNIVVFASQIEGRCNIVIIKKKEYEVVCASQIEGRCNRINLHNTLF